MLEADMAQRGVIPFSRFMEVALYAPGIGYYERQENVVGRAGDYMTGVSSGSLFGELLGLQFRSWLERIDGEHVYLIEAGAHGGMLAVDLLDWFRAREPAVWSRLRYLIVEPSAIRQAWQRETLKGFSDRVEWFQEVDQLPGELRGILFCNELLDAMPVRRLGWDHGRWFEWGVTLRDGGLEWGHLPLRDGEAEELLEAACLNLSSDLLRVLPRGFTLDLGSAGADWWERAVSRLKVGRAVLIDYGLEADEFLHPGRIEGTLRAYRNHHLMKDPLADPGAQDLTAHVNFTQLRKAGERAGLSTERLVSQEEFFMRICREFSPAESWSPSRKRHFMTLCHPEHMGRAFRVLVQSRGAR